MKTGIELITEERQRQVEVEGYQPELDARHKNGEMAGAAACYAMHDLRIQSGSLRHAVMHIVHDLWPWADHYWKPKSQITNLVRAGALISAEIDRLQGTSSEGVKLAHGLVSQVSALDAALERICITAKWGVVDPSSAREQLETIAELAQLAINRQPLPPYEGEGEPEAKRDGSKRSWIDNLPPGCEPEDFEVAP